MRSLIVTEWVSLDGIFNSGSMDKWWNPFDSPERHKYIQDTINNCGIMLYGCTTYEMLYPYWSSFKDNAMGVAVKLNKTKKYVVSSSLKKVNWENMVILDNDFLEELARLKKQDGGYILVQGSSSLLKPLLETGLVNEVRLLINPAIVGVGSRPFVGEIKCFLEFSEFHQLDKHVLLLTYKTGIATAL